MIKTFLKIIALFFGGICIFLGIVLSYGYWHSSTHASFHVELNYKDSTTKISSPFPKAEITFLDSDGYVLANGVCDEKINFVHLIHPEVGDCYMITKSIPSSTKTRKAWQECYKHLATWIPKWADKVRRVNLKASGCTIPDIPVTVSKYNSGWWLWWVPLPHVFGKPYSYYSMDIAIEEGDCTN